MEQRNFVRRLARKLAPLGVGIGALGMQMAHATGTPVDVSAVTDGITAQAAPIAAVGAAILVLFVGIKAFKWVRRAMS